MDSSVTFPCNGQTATALAEKALVERGCNVVRTFDLLGSDADDCGCPHHGTALCTCQYSVLLVYPASGAPAVVTVHGRGERTRVEVVQDPNEPPDPNFVRWILDGLHGIVEAPVQGDCAAPPPPAHDR